jgi:hypothetical protein
MSSHPPPYSCRRKKGFASFIGPILLLNSLTEVKCLCAESPSIFRKGVYHHHGQVDGPHRMICAEQQDEEEEQEKRFAFFRQASSQLTAANAVVNCNHAQQRVESDLQQARFAVTYQDELDELNLVKNAYLIQDRIQYLKSIVVPASKIRIIRRGALDTIHI